MTRAEGVHSPTPETFADGKLPFEAVQKHELERIAAKRPTGRYRPGERGWVKTKNRDYWRWEMEHESAITGPRAKQFV